VAYFLRNDPPLDILTQHEGVGSSLDCFRIQVERVCIKTIIAPCITNATGNVVERMVYPPC